MDQPTLNIVRAADIDTHAQEFSHPWNANSQMRGMQLARSVGLRRTGVNFIRVPAGKDSFVYHSHQHEEEWIYILEGRAIATIDGADYDLGPGDFMGFPTPSVAHNLRNPGPGDLVYLVGGENRDVEITEFPRDRKRVTRNGKLFDVTDL